MRRRLKILNVICYLIATTNFLYAVQQATTDFATYAPMVYMNLALVAAVLLVPVAHRVNEIAGGVLLVVVEYAALVGFAAFFSREGGAHLQYFIAAAAAFVIFGLRRMWLIAVVVLVGLGLHLYVWYSFPATGQVAPHEQAVIDSLYTQGAITTVVLIAASVYYAFSLAEQAKAETDAVLRNVLPDAIVERLKANPGALIADSIDDAAVMFADISGFVALTRRLGANATVDMLSRIVSDFDALAVRHGVEKIKTIGDAYMVVAGLPEPVPDHTARLARMGLEHARFRGADARGERAQSQPAHRHGIGTCHRRRHRHAQIQLRRVGRPGEPRQSARRPVIARAHPHLPGLPRKAGRGLHLRGARTDRDQRHRGAGNLVPRR